MSKITFEHVDGLLCCGTVFCCIVGNSVRMRLICHFFSSFYNVIGMIYNRCVAYRERFIYT